MKTVSLFNHKKNFKRCSRVFERALTFAEIAQLSHECELARREIVPAKSVKPPLTFVVPAQQIIASVSRFVE
jgi:hypothetical protein